MYIPSDFETFWSFWNGCGVTLFHDTYTYMDTFRVMFRQPFSQYLLGEYYWGYIKTIDSITTSSSFIGERNDSILYVYASFTVVEKFSSPYTKEIYFAPIPEDIKHDKTNGFQFYKKLQSKLNDTVVQDKNVCIMMTKQEVESLEKNNAPTKRILLRMADDASADSINMVFCSQPFFDRYTKELLVAEKQVIMYKLLRYQQLYYDVFKEEFPEK